MGGTHFLEETLKAFSWNQSSNPTLAGASYGFGMDGAVSLVSVLADKFWVWEIHVNHAILLGNAEIKEFCT
jgi:hypothetical protein